jgi:hypothetical protein
MPSSEDDIRIDPAFSFPGIGARSFAGGGEVETEFENVVPLASNYDLTEVADEEAQRLLVVPDTMRDLVAHHDSFDVTKGKLQVITYKTQLVENYRRAFNPLIFHCNLGVGFGTEYTRQGTAIGSVDPVGIAAAFQVRVDPRNK